MFKVRWSIRLDELFPALVTTNDLYDQIQTELPFNSQFLKNGNDYYEQNIWMCNKFWRWTYNFYQFDSHFWKHVKKFIETISVNIKRRMKQSGVVRENIPAHLEQLSN